MHINRLRLLGFKSFVEPTELVIEQGLTGVVGPNGCGKSNLLEALRWVMGETSHKSMRAASMDDVIFNGTTTRPPRIRLAEVSPITQRSASTRLDLPQPFGPTTPVRPGSITKSVGSTNDLNPWRRRRVSFMDTILYWQGANLPAGTIP